MLDNIKQYSEKPKKKEVSRFWMYAAFTAIGLLLFSYLSGKYQQIEFKWIVVATGLVLLYLGIKSYLDKEKELTYEKMIELIRQNTYQEGYNLNYNPENIVCEPLGRGYAGLRFVQQNVTFLISKGKYIGRTTKTLTQMQQQINENRLQEILAAQGITDQEEE